MIICLTGLAGSGKNTVANYLNELIYNSEIISIGESLKEIVAVMCGVDIDMLRGNSKESRTWREKHNHKMSYIVGDKLMTPREILCKVADDYRMLYGEDVFMRMLSHKHFKEQSDKVYIISDLRYYSDYEYLKSICQDIIVINVIRTIPFWYTAAHDYNKGYIKYVPSCLDSVHPSERDLIGRIDYDYEIMNDDTVEKLRFRVMQIYSRNGFYWIH